MIMAKGCPYEAATLMLQGGSGLRYMKESIMAKIEKEPEVEKITPILMSAVFDPNKGERGGIAGYFGIDAKSFAELKPFLKFKQGGWFTDPNAYEVVMGFEAAELETREVGDLILMPEKNVQLKVSASWNGRAPRTTGRSSSPSRRSRRCSTPPRTSPPSASN